LTQPAISLPLRPNIPIIHQSWDWYRITQPGAHPASPDGLTSTAGIAIASATAASLICGRPPTEASPFSRWLDNVICFRSSFARLNLWFTYYCVLVVPVTRVIYYIVLFYVYRVRKTHFIVFFCSSKGACDDNTFCNMTPITSNLDIPNKEAHTPSDSFCLACSEGRVRLYPLKYRSDSNNHIHLFHFITGKRRRQRASRLSWLRNEGVAQEIIPVIRSKVWIYNILFIFI
jgi:hypothetical protein